MQVSLVPDPVLLPADTSALIPLAVSNQLGRLSLLKKLYGIQVVVSEPVEEELYNVASRKDLRYGGGGKRCQQGVERAFSKGALLILDKALLTARGVGGSDADALLCEIEQKGRTLEQYVGQGEAYTHAMAEALKSPILTQDFSAVRVLIGLGHLGYEYFLRSLDVLALSLQIDAMTIQECEGARREMETYGESIERCFLNRSFEDGLPFFYQRLADDSCPCVGAPAPLDRSFDQRFFIKRRNRP